MEKYRYKDAMLFVILLFIASFVMGISYAAINSTQLSISGTATAESFKGLYISEVKFSSDAYSEDENSSNTYDALVLTSDITLSASQLNSYIEYDITISNTTNYTYAYKGNETASSFYSNNGIIYEISGINVNDEISALSTKTFKIRFKYSDSISTISSSTLSAMISFKFSKVYSVSYVGVTGSLPTKAYENETFSATIGESFGTINIKIGGTNYVGYTYLNGVLTIPGTAINGDITIAPQEDTGEITASATPTSIELSGTTKVGLTLQVTSTYIQKQTFTLSLSNSNFELVNASGDALNSFELPSGTNSYNVYIRIKSGVNFYYSNTETVYLVVNTNHGDIANTNNITVTVPLYDTTPPTINAITLTLNEDTGAINVNWSGQDDKGGTIKYTIILCNTSNSNQVTYNYSSASTSTLSYSISGLSTGVYYYVKIYGEDQYGNSGSSYASSATTSTTYCRSSEQLAMYSITYNLSGCTSGNTANYIVAGEKYETTISFTGSNKYLALSSTVTMGGENLERGNGYTYNTDTHLASIPSVTGNVVINATGTRIYCIVKGTKITLADGTKKNIEDINYNDLLLVYNHEKGGVTYEYPIWIEKGNIASEYQITTFDDGSFLKTIGEHAVFCTDKNRYVDVSNKDEFYIGIHILKVNENNELYTVTVTNIEKIYENVEYYDIVSTRYYNVIADDVLTSDGRTDLSNVYEFKENAIWSDRTQEVLKNNIKLSYSQMSFVPYYLFTGLRAEDGAVLFEYGYMNKEKFFSIFTDALLNSNMMKEPRVNEKGTRIWMVTTSDDKVTDENKDNYLVEEGTIYTLPKPLNIENFVCWYNTADAKTYNSGDKVQIWQGTHFVAQYK